MRELRIKKLELENFKCHRHLVLDFDGRDAVIYGDNATGKSSIYDAVTWLLFGKDSLGNGEKSVEVKPLDEKGEVRDHDAITAVGLWLTNDGEEVSLRRTYKEVWSTKRGSGEATYDGNTSEYYIDGVPCKKNAFYEQVGMLVTEETFRMLTSVSYFASTLPWQERRRVLAEAAGIPEDRLILETDPRFLPLLEGMGKLSPEDYKKKLISSRKGLSVTKNELPARLSECQKTLEELAEVDFGEARCKAQELRKDAEELGREILALENDSASDKKRMEIREAKLELSSLQAENRVFRASQEAENVDTEPMKRDIANIEREKKSKEAQLVSLEDALRLRDRELEDSRKRWIEIENEAFSGECTCPTCGQALPAARLQAAKDLFEEEKSRRLREVERLADVQKRSREETEEHIGILQREILALEERKTAQLTAINMAEATVRVPVDLPGYAEQCKAIQDKIDTLTAELADLQLGTSSVREALRRQQKELRTEAAAWEAVSGKEAILTYTKGRMDTLREDARRASEQMELLERQLWLLEEYGRYKASFIEDSINGMFRLARFRLFREQANGGLEERCDVMYGGVPYLGVNNGMKISLGVDIINTLSEHYGVRVPLFIDNAESVTALEPSRSQCIRLVVSEAHKELEVVYED